MPTTGSAAAVSTRHQSREAAARPQTGGGARDTRTTAQTDKDSARVPSQRMKTLPPPSERILSSTMERQILTSKGIVWKSMQVVLSANYMFLSKVLNMSDAEQINMNHWPDVYTHTNKLYEVFTKYDTDSSNSLDESEVGKALKDLGLFESEETTHHLLSELFSSLDSDQSGDLNWEEFKGWLPLPIDIYVHTLILYV
jgi:hypothetical protein